MTNGSPDTLGTPSAGVVPIDWEEQIRLLRASDAYQTEDQASRTLARHSALRVVLVALKADARVDEHHADSVISAHCLDGHCRFEVAGAAYDLTPGTCSSSPSACRIALSPWMSLPSFSPSPSRTAMSTLLTTHSGS